MPKIAKIFTDSGITKLSDLKTKVLAIKDYSFKGTESSAHSRKMVDNVVEIIEQLIAHNDIDYWRNVDKQEFLLKLIDKLDDGHGTFVPEIFNKESYLLAQALSTTLNRVDLKADISSLVSKLLDPQDTFNTMVSYLQNKINFYDVLANNKKHDELKANVENNFFKALSNFTMEVESELTNANDENFKQKYAQFVKEMLKQIDTLQYVKISNSASFIDVATPYQLKSEDVYSTGNRGVIIGVVLRCEENINKVLQEKKLPLVHHFHDHYSKQFDPKAYQQTEQKLSAIITNLKTEKAKYANGEFMKGFLSSFRKPDADKVAVFNLLETAIDTAATKLTVKNDALLPTGIRAFEMFTLILDAERKNEEICARKDKSLGELSKILSKFKWEFFNLTYYGINETNDSGVGHNINLYRKFLNLDLSPIKIGNEVKPEQLNEHNVSNTTTSSSKNAR